MDMVEGEEGEGGMYGERNIEIYNTICKIDSQWEFAVWFRELKQGLCDRLKDGMAREMGGRTGREETWVYLWLILVDVWQKNTKFCKAIILQSKKIKKIKEKNQMIYSAIKKNTFESVLMRWMKLEPIIQSEVSQKEKHQYSILMHIYGI